MKRPWLLGTVFALVLILAVGGVYAQGTTMASDCQTIDEERLCIEEFTTPEEPLVQGEQSEFSLTVTNDGEVPATGVVMLHTVNPENETSAYQMNQITLDPGESETLTRPINASTPGTHGLRLSIVDPDTGEFYDISDIAVVEVLEEPPMQLGGPIDRTEIALAVLIVATLGVLGMGYRFVKR